jgi:hypothetical protein
MTAEKPFLLPSGKLYLSEMVQQATVGTDHPAAVSVKKPVGMYPSQASALVIDPKSGMTRPIGECLRKGWYKLRNTPPSDISIDPKMTRIQRAGEVIADRFVYDMAKRAGIYVADEISFYDPDHMLSGRYDIMVRLPNGDLMGSDVKTISGWKEIPHIASGRNGYDCLEPRWKDVCQIMCYMQWYLQHGVKYWSLLYMSREFSIGEFVFEWANLPPGALRAEEDTYLRCYSSERVWDVPWLTWGQIKRRFYQLHKSLVDKVPPPRDYQISYDNATLVTMAKAGGSGNQLIPLNKTEGEMILRKYEKMVKKGEESNINSLPPFLEKGDNECGYCEYRTMCWFGINPDLPPKTIEVPKTEVVDSPQVDLM